MERAMNVPLSWLREFVDLTLSPRDLAARLTMAGVEVEAIREIGAEWDQVFVGHVEHVEQHPNADRLNLVRVVAGERELTVVTGAPNIAVGQNVPLALVGARLWDGHSDEPKRITLKASTIRGVPSQGMVCSEKELGLSDEHEGIMVLPADAPVGTPLQEYLGDTVLELEITPNLVHDFSVLGVAREVAALTAQELHPPRVPALPQAKGAVGSDGAPLVAIEAPDLCARCVGVVIEGLTVGESPEWLKSRLTAAGLRSINNIADVTNYVMLEWGQPLHAYDRDRLAGGRIVVRAARAGEQIESLDHVTRTLDERMLVIGDAERAVGIAGVMGGADSEISDGTTNVLLEAANFNQYAVRHAMQTLKLPSDAAVRFGRGLDPNLAWEAVARATALILDLCPGARVTATADAYPAPVGPRTIDLPYGEIGRLLGVTYPVEQTVEVLGRLELRAEILSGADGGEPTLRVTVPTWRQDLTQSADLVEEIIRVIGYDTLPTTLPEGQTTPPRRDPLLLFAEEVRDILAASGLNEIICYSLTDEPTIDRLAPGGRWTTWWEGDRPDFAATRLVNTLRSDWQILRPTLLADALKTLADNLKFRPTVRLFEVRPIYLPRQLGQLPTERLTLSIALAGERSGRSLYTAPGEAGAPLDFFDLKGVVEALVARLGVREVTYTPGDYAAFSPGRAAELRIGGELIGVFGEAHPQVADNFGVAAARTMLAEFDVEALFARVGQRAEIASTTRFQPTIQDFAVVVDEATPAGAVEEAILRASGPLARSARLFDVYRGEQIPVGKKSLAFEVTFSAPNRALPDHEIERVRGRIAGMLQKRLKATLRA
jgi:phenylalanyl-tRNA synthetase beta chain